MRQSRVLRIVQPARRALRYGAGRLPGTLRGGKVPHGYRRDRQTKLIHPHVPQADVVRLIFGMYVDGRMGAEAIRRR
jgi:hypothetical protein